MVRKTNWMGIGAFGTLVMAAAIAGCANQNGNPDNIAAGPRPSVKTATGTGTTATTGQFDDAANTWSQVEEGRAELDTAIKARNFDQVHAATSKIRDLVNSLPDKSAMLPEDKRKTLDSHVKNVDELTAMMDKFNDPNDMKPAQEHQTAMNDALDMMKGMYPAEAMRQPMHMPNMGSSGMGMSGMGRKMGGMGTSAGAGNMSRMGATMGGMSTMDKMTSGMSTMDQNEMRMTLDKVMAMPPAERKRAMQKMSGMSGSTDPGNQPDPGGTPMPGGNMGGSR